MFPIIKAEIKKSGIRYTRRFKILLLIFALSTFAASYLSFNHGFNSDYWLYNSASDRYVIDSKLFHHSIIEREIGLSYLKKGKIDVFITDKFIVVSNSFKSLSSGEEIKSYVEKAFENQLYKMYGHYAFPVFARAVYVKRGIELTQKIKPIPEEKIKEIEEIAKKEEKRVEDRERVAEKALIEEKHAEEVVKLSKWEEGYYSPREFSPPSLISKMIQAFIFLIPPFFAMQIFSSSLAEDVRKDRISVLLSTPLTARSYIIQKLLPYFLLSLLLISIPSLFLWVDGARYLLFPLIFLFSLHTFIAITSRSYRELTFLILVANLLTVIYLILPSIFAGLPLSEISPLTFMLKDLSGEIVSPMETLISSLPLAIGGITMFCLSTQALHSAHIKSQESPARMFFSNLSELSQKDLNAFILSMVSVSFALFAEFFLLFFGLSLPILTSFAFIMLGVALVEEALKSAIIYPKRTLRRAFIVSSGFFIAEKGLLFLNLFKDFSIVMPGQFILYPFLIHLLSSSSFAIFSKKDYRIGYLIAVSIHFAYNYGVLL